MVEGGIAGGGMEFVFGGVSEIRRGCKGGVYILVTRFVIIAYSVSVIKYYKIESVLHSFMNQEVE